MYTQITRLYANFCASEVYTKMTGLYVNVCTREVYTQIAGLCVNVCAREAYTQMTGLYVDVCTQEALLELNLAKKPDWVTLENFLYFAVCGHQVTRKAIIFFSVQSRVP